MKPTHILLHSSFTLMFFFKSAHNKCLILPIKAMSVEMKCHKKSALYTMGYIQNNNMCPIHLRSTVTNITASIRLDFATIHIEQQTSQDIHS